MIYGEHALCHQVGQHAVGLCICQRRLKQRGKAGLVAPVAQQFGEVAKMSPSQQRDAMQKACTSERGDAVIAGRTGDARTNRMTYLIGKADTELDMDVQVLQCKTNATAAVRVVFKFDAAIQGSPQESYRRAGVSFGKVVLEVTTSN